MSQYVRFKVRMTAGGMLRILAKEPAWRREWRRRQLTRRARRAKRRR